MSYRFMRLIVMFDLPTETSEDRHNYTVFRRQLIKSGFIMLQESVYTKLMITPSVKESIMQMLKKNKPPKGVVCALEVTEKQFSRMDYIVGELHSDVINSDERLVIL